MDILDVDPADDAAMAAWHAAYLEADLFERDSPTPWQLPELLAEARATRTQHRYAFVVGRTGDDAVVAAGRITVDLLSNSHIAFVEVYVRPAHRRRGHGRAVLGRLEEIARSWGCTSALSESAWPSDLGPEGAGAPGREFARATGFRLGLVDVQRTVTLPIASDLLAALAEEARAAYQPGYRLDTWSGPVPEEYAEGWARLGALVATEAPMGELEFDPESPSVEALRQREAVQAAQGRTKHNTVAVDRDGAVVAYSDIATTVHEPGVAYQWGTLVDPAHRGHRLGLAVKVANLVHLQASRPDIVRLTTYNAEVNDHMIAINRQLGFEPVEYLGEFQRSVQAQTSNPRISSATQSR
jgi:GNAT superfamily N-acetyltransferase